MLVHQEVGVGGLQQGVVLRRLNVKVPGIEYLARPHGLEARRRLPAFPGSRRLFVRDAAGGAGGNLLAQHLIALAHHMRANAVCKPGIVLCPIGGGGLMLADGFGAGALGAIIKRLQPFQMNVAAGAKLHHIRVGTAGADFS